MEKECPHCRGIKSYDGFYKDKSRQSGISSWCKDCLLDKAKERRRTNPEQYRAIARKYYYKNQNKILSALRAKGRKRSVEQKKLSWGFYNELFAAQDGKCLICGIHADEAYNGLHIDHDHVTGEVRGLLCHKCNTALGLFQDNVEFLKTAADYLNNSRKDR